MAGRFVLITSLVVLVAPLQAQSEAALKEHFEGRSVRLKLAMPGAEQGVDIYPGTPRPLDFPRHADRLKDFGTAIPVGQTAMVTKIKLKAKHIEFQLDGGGYGTFGDETSSSVSVPQAPKTKREQNLEGELKRETDPAKRRAIKEELDDLRKEREREDARNRASVAAAEEHREENIRQRRLQGGSRFNIRYADQVPAQALTPESVEAALAEYVDFEVAGGRPDSRPGEEPGPAPAAKGPRKGMLVREADAAMGTPVETSERMEGKLKVVTRTYDTPDGRVTAEFAEGVLFRFTVTSQ